MTGWRGLPAAGRSLWAGGGAATVLVLTAAVLLLRAGSLDVPMAEVVRGEFVEHLQLRGEIRPVRSISVTAPSQAGDLQITRLVANGAQVKKGDVIVQFNTATLERTVQEKRSELRQAVAEVDQARAEGRQKAEEDRTALAQARYDLERAKLEVKKQEFLSKIEFEKAKLAVADAEHALVEVETRLRADRDAAAAEEARRNQKRERAAAEAARAGQQIAALTLLAPADGLVTLMPNYRAGAIFSDSPPEFREGDRAWSGAVIAELPDLSAVRVAARLDEMDRGRLQVGQTAAVKVDAVPDREFEASIVTISVLARVDFSSWPPPKNFDLELAVADPDPRLRPGMSASVRLPLGRVAEAIMIPAKAVFQRDGHPVAYVLSGSRFEPRRIVVGSTSGDRTRIVSGLSPGERVALVDPTTTDTGAQR
jgi:HlyD family secretion protein